MGQAEKQYWINREPEIGEPVFGASFSAHITSTTIEVLRGRDLQVEQELLGLISDCWNSDGLKDIKVFKNHSKSEYLIVSSWDYLRLNSGSISKNNQQSVLQKLQPLVEAKTIQILDHQQGNYDIIE